jgi:hypothetical protein
MSPAELNTKKRKLDQPRIPGEAFKRVNVETWSKEIKKGLEDNSCNKFS